MELKMTMTAMVVQCTAEPTKEEKSMAFDMALFSVGINTTKMKGWALCELAQETLDCNNLNNTKYFKDKNRCKK